MFESVVGFIRDYIVSGEDELKEASTHHAAVEDPASKAALQIPPNLAAHRSSDRYVTIVGIYREPRGFNEGRHSISFH